MPSLAFSRINLGTTFHTVREAYYVLGEHVRGARFVP